MDGVAMTSVGRQRGAVSGFGPALLLDMGGIGGEGSKHYERSPPIPRYDRKTTIPWALNIGVKGRRDITVGRPICRP